MEPELEPRNLYPKCLKLVRIKFAQNGHTIVVQVFQVQTLLSATDYTISGTTLTFNTQPVSLGDAITVNVYPKQFYRLGQVLYTAGALPTQELQRVDRGELYHLLSSNLTQPTTTYPIYTYKNNQITVYPDSIISGITLAISKEDLTYSKKKK